MRSTGVEVREKIILVGAVALLAFSPTASFGQQRSPPTPPNSQILSLIGVSAPLIERNVVNRRT